MLMLLLVTALLGGRGKLRGWKADGKGIGRVLVEDGDEEEAVHVVCEDPERVDEERVLEQPNETPESREVLVCEVLLMLGFVRKGGREIGVGLGVGVESRTRCDHSWPQFRVCVDCPMLCARLNVAAGTVIAAGAAITSGLSMGNSPGMLAFFSESGSGLMMGSVFTLISRFTRSTSSFSGSSTGVVLFSEALEAVDATDSFERFL